MSKLSRRGLFGFIGKAAVAAPAVPAMINEALAKPPAPIIANSYIDGFGDGCSYSVGVTTQLSYYTIDDLKE